MIELIVVSFFLFILIYKKSKNIKVAVIFAGLAYLNVCFAIGIAHSAVESWRLNLPRIVLQYIPFLLIFLISLILGRWMGWRLKREKVKVIETFSLYRIFLTFVSITLILGTIYLIVQMKTFDHLILIIAALVWIFIFVTHKMYVDYLKKEMERVRLKTEEQQFKTYLHSLESSIKALRHFKHDYQNTLNGIYD